MILQQTWGLQLKREPEEHRLVKVFRVWTGFSSDILALINSHVFSQGQEMQRACVISNLPSLVRQNPAETFRRVVPKVRVCKHHKAASDFKRWRGFTWYASVLQEVLNGAGVEIQLAAAASFLTILQDDIILIHTHTYSILKTVLQQLNHRDTGKLTWTTETQLGFDLDLIDLYKYLNNTILKSIKFRVIKAILHIR